MGIFRKKENLKSLFTYASQKPSEKISEFIRQKYIEPSPQLDRKYIGH